MLPRIAASVAAALLLVACSETPVGVDPEQVDSVEVPELGACRLLTIEDVSEASNATEVVDCAEEHTAETFAVGTLPERLADAAYDSPELSSYMLETCDKRLEAFLGGDESAIMRSILTWAWFRPSETAWADGARWYRCDVIAGEYAGELTPLPETARGLLLDRPDDRWMTCADGATVADSVKVPCSEPHTWRAVTTIKLGQPEDPYPGDRLVEVRSRDFCSDSVGAWMNYPVDYQFGYTYFHEAEWKTGNRRSICWARTDQ